MSRRRRASIRFEPRPRGGGRRLAPALVVAGGLVLSGMLLGCSPYMVRGKVVSGPASDARVVKSDDPALAGPPIEQATVQLVLDPLSGGRERLGTVLTDENGEFAMPVEVFGAGTLEYELLVTARHPGRSPAQQVLDLPPSHRRLLIRLAEGRDRPVGADAWGGGIDTRGWDRFEDRTGGP